MKTSKKILIAVCAVVLAAAVIVGVVYKLSAQKVPELDEEKLRLSPISYSTVFVVGQPPYADDWVFDTPMGLNNYWIDNHSGGNGMEIVVQQTKDGELIMLSEALPAMSNADDLYGSDVSVADLTLDEMRKINLAYDAVDEDGFRAYVGLKGDALADVSVVTLDEALEYFGAPNRTTVRLFLRFFDESQISDMQAALQTIYSGLTANMLEENAVFCPQSQAAADAADAACPDMLRAATTAEAKELYSDSTRGNTPDSLPYSVIYEKADSKFGSEAFIHYVRNLGMVIVLSDIDTDDVVRYRDYGVTAIAAKDAPTYIKILKDAKKADRESKTEAD